MIKNDPEGQRVWCVIPVYNNGETLRGVVRGCREHLDNIVVVDDGCTDIEVGRVLAEEQVVVIRHETNQGKGAALMTGFEYARDQGAEYALTIDADGQHDPRDIPSILAEIKGREDLLVIGARDFNADNVPGKSKFGRKFANFWFKVETGLFVNDCQSGYRAYPLKHILNLNLSGLYYDFETEVITKAAWAGLKIKTVEVGVHYAKKGERVSHFKGFLDNARISKMHAGLVLRRLSPIPHKKLIVREEDLIYKDLFKHPLRVLRSLLKENASPEGLAAAAAVGILLAVLPLIATHTIAIIYVTARLHLNKVMAVSIQNLCVPPFVPVLCIEVGHFMRHGTWLTEVSTDVIFRQALDRIWEWFLGSLIVAPVLAAVTGIIVYGISSFVQRKPKMEVAG